MLSFVILLEWDPGPLIHIQIFQPGFQLLMHKPDIRLLVYNGIFIIKAWILSQIIYKVVNICYGIPKYGSARSTV